MIYDLKVTTRENKQKEELQDFVPGIVYGPEVKENVMVFVKTNDFIKLYEQAGESSMINLTVDEGEVPLEVLIKSVSLDSVKGSFQHVDFYQIKRGQKLEIEVELSFVGEAPAIRAFGGIMVANLNAIEVRCLPKDMISEIEVDISGLKNIGDKIHVRDLKIPENVEVLNDLDETVVLIDEPAAEEAADKAPVVDAAAVPVEGEKPEEQKATAEGEKTKEK